MTDQQAPEQTPVVITPMTFAENAHAATQLALRKVWKVANRPLASVAWQGGYEGETIISFIPRTAPVVAIMAGLIGATTGLAGPLTGIELTPEGVRVIQWAIGIGVSSYSFGQYIDAQLSKIKGYVDDVEKRPRYAGSINVGDQLVTASQSATCGRIIHQTGFGVMGKLGVEIREAKTKKIMDRLRAKGEAATPLDMANLTSEDRFELLNDYGVMCEQMGLAHREGFEKVNGMLPQNFGDRFLKPIHRAFVELSKESKHGELCAMYRAIQRTELPEATRMLDLYEQRLRQTAKSPAAAPC